MKIIRLAIVGLLTTALSGVPAFAGELQDSIAKAAAHAAADTQETPMLRTGGRSVTLVAGSALFAGGMAFSLYNFINNGNGSYSEFGEAEATNPKLGAAGLAAAFAGGLLMFKGRRAAQMPSVTVGASSVGLSKRVSW